MYSLYGDITKLFEVTDMILFYQHVLHLTVSIIINSSVDKLTNP